MLARGAIAFLLIAAAPPPLTADGWGALKVGMPEAEAVRLFGLVIPPDDGVLGPECRQIPVPEGGEGMEVMTQHGRVTRISIFEGNRLKTDSGLGLNATEPDVRRTYGAGLKVEPHYYEGEPAHYLTAWSTSGRGIRFETDTLGVVTTIHVGDDSIQLVEGCL